MENLSIGSVGQPRSGRKGAQWCIFDTKLMKLILSPRPMMRHRFLTSYQSMEEMFTLLTRKWESLE